ncbi:hypothetical protein BAE44_0022380 [Dichanthelium oligosanthes]|uniref:DUF1618 domain-containing protein n=1 Tax=Dichanthelium oligosanthes TaxID=888268 RepID=A0A1E5UUQ5_9POAL|nr:hypothetical protein BAE44_0022380 [Dichanthelium oligosanthes]
MKSGRDPYCRWLCRHDTGVLRRGDGDDDLVVAQLEVMPSYSERRGMADLCVLRHGRSQWELKRSLPIVHDEGDKGDEVLDAWQSSTVVPVADRYLCWVEYHSGLIICDMAAEDDASPKLRYLPLPNYPYDSSYYTNDMIWSL